MEAQNTKTKIYIKKRNFPHTLQMSKELAEITMDSYDTFFVYIEKEKENCKETIKLKKIFLSL